MPGSESQTTTDAFWHTVCEFTQSLFILIGLSTTLLVLSVIALPFVEPGSGSEVIVFIDILLLVMLLGGALVVLFVCESRTVEAQPVG